ncbi:hypothetical protein GUITHDRAFT_99231 [Guillardia theta CCMP2712]|uniref:Uncharacterized protein n=1 Tax=Guillardia theta (strain CCMP2712) TaxID=905079 RepID=L1K4C5_GUITC|nr:hypothetical protein GUITHDRAFT_99231 [Guillardia theta CCMP2712]EKX55454.1 hypothetical protein GUITHDRAFT_99231 [Guillardia theta CCMP2712]|eukprot:XP_005842434.1 hypothetical protein GUITHDRAFT_99231 [Guillardia theta CCMP2712]
MKKQTKLRKGSKVEVEAEGEWWEAEVIDINANFVHIHYVGGMDEENEWLDVESHRIRAPQAVSYQEEMEEVGGNFPVDMELEDVDVLPVDIEEHDSSQSLSGNSSSKTKPVKGPNKASKKNKQAGLRFTPSRKGSAPKLSWIDRLGEGWDRVPKDEKGRYVYISPDGQTFQSLTLAQQYAESSMQIPVNEAVVDPYIPKVRKKSGGSFGKAFLRDFEEKWYQKRYDDVRKCLLRRNIIAESDTVIDYMKKKTWDEADFKKAMFSQESKDDFAHISLLMSIRQNLIDAGHLRFPVIYFSPNLKLSANEVSKLKAIAQKRGAKLTSDLRAATHQIIDDTPDMKETEETFCRQLDRQKTKKEPIAYVHWWFYPDSYDEWVPQREVEGDMCATSVRKFWKVCVRWLKDTDKFNEWMNEDDYLPEDPEDEVAEMGEKSRWTEEEDAVLLSEFSKLGKKWEEIARKLPNRSVSALKLRIKTLAKKLESKSRRPSSEFSSPSKKKKVEQEVSPSKKKRAEQEEMTKSKKKLIQRVLSLQHECWEDQQDLEASYRAEPQLWDLPAFDPDAELELCGEGTTIHGEAAQSQVKEEKTNPLILPMQASWFDMGAIHEMERVGVPEYFEGKHPSKTPEAYKWHRDAIVTLWCEYLAGYFSHSISNDRGDEDGGEEVEARTRSRAGGKRRSSVTKGGKSKGKADKQDLQSRFSSDSPLRWPPKLHVREFLRRIPGHATDILRIFQFLESLGIINHTCQEEDSPGPLWTERDLQRLEEAYRKHGPKWALIGKELNDRPAADCAIFFSSIPLHETPFASSLRSERMRLKDGERSSLDGDLVAQRAHFLQNLLGPEATAAVIDNVLQEERQGGEKEQGERAEQGGHMEQREKKEQGGEHQQVWRMQTQACRAALLTSTRVRAMVLAHEETMRMKKLLLEAIELQMQRMQMKVTSLMSQQSIISQVM